MRFGMHLSISPRFASAATAASKLGCGCLQIFSGNPRGWKKKPIDPARAAEFRRAVSEFALGPVIVHASYLINPASPKRSIRSKSLSALKEELERSATLGAEYYVLHPGNHLGSGPEAGIARLAAALDEALSGPRKRPARGGRPGIPPRPHPSSDRSRMQNH